jgi:hypothetical protein
MNDSDRKSPEDFEVGFFRPEDAEGIVALFRSVYGEGYPIRMFYDPAAIASANAAGDYYSIVARTAAGHVGGVVHLFRSAPNPDIYESGAGLVMKECRQLGLNHRLLRFQLEDWAPGRENVHVIYGEAVCNHPYMQKSVVELAFTATALEVALMPAEAYSTEKSAPGRVASLFMAKTYRPRPHKVHIPAVYERELGSIYARLDDERTLIPADTPAYEEPVSAIDMTLFDFAQVARMAVSAVGADFPERARALEEEARGKNALVLQAWLPMHTQAIGPAVDCLRGRGYFFGGLLPQWFRHDALLMQKIFCPPDFENIHLYEEQSKQVFEMVKEDWRRVQGGTS